jgi:hypothetical protein
MTINDKEVKTTADFSVGLLGIRKLFIVRWSILGVGVQPPVDVPLLPSMNSLVTAGVPPALLATLSPDPRKHCKRKSEDSKPAEKKQDAKRYHITMDKPPTNLIEVIPPMTMGMASSFITTSAEIMDKIEAELIEAGYGRNNRNNCGSPWSTWTGHHCTTQRWCKDRNNQTGLPISRQGLSR